jgi:chemotaxis protein CheC
MPETVTALSSLQLDALRELANIGSGNAGTSLSQLVGRSVDLSVPNAAVLPFADAVDAAGPAEDEATGVVIPLIGDMDAVVLLLFPTESATTLCAMLGVEAGTEDGLSALGEIGNILSAAYISSLTAMTGLDLDLTPPEAVTDMLAAIVATVLSMRAGETDSALILDSDLQVEGEQCSISFLLLPAAGGVRDILARMGVDA